MPNNDNFYDNIDDYINEASKSTDKKLALYLSSLTGLNDKEILTMFPDTESLNNLNELIRIVKNATSHNQKVNQLVENAEKFGDTAIKLISKILV